MGAITGTKVGDTEFAGKYKIITVTATIAAASDTITLNAADHGGVVSIKAILGVHITAGLDAAFSYLQASFSDLVITVASFEQDGTAATDFTGTTISMSLLVAVE